MEGAELVEKGKLIEFRVQGERRLAVADRPEGKKDWIAIDREGQAHKIRPQRIEYSVNDGLYEVSDIPSFVSQVESYLDPGSLEIAWEILAENLVSTTPEEMAELLRSRILYCVMPLIVC